MTVPAVGSCMVWLCTGIRNSGFWPPLPADKGLASTKLNQVIMEMLWLMSLAVSAGRKPGTPNRIQR